MFLENGDRKILEGIFGLGRSVFARYLILTNRRLIIFKQKYQDLGTDTYLTDPKYYQEFEMEIPLSEIKECTTRQISDQLLALLLILKDGTEHDLFFNGDPAVYHHGDNTAILKSIDRQTLMWVTAINYALEAYWEYQYVASDGRDLTV